MPGSTRWLFVEPAVAVVPGFQPTADNNRLSRGSAPGSTDCRWRSSGRGAVADDVGGADPGAARRPLCGVYSWQPGCAERSKPWGGASAGAMTCARPPNNSCGPGSRCSPAASNWKPQKTFAAETWARRTWTICSPRWWTSRLRIRAQFNGPGALPGSWRPCAITAARRSRQPASIPNCAVGTWAGTND